MKILDISGLNSSWKTMSLKAIFVVILGVIFIFGCSGGSGGGGGGGGEANNSAIPELEVAGQAVLGPLSGAEISIADLNGLLIASGTTTQSTDMADAGAFSYKIAETDIPDIMIASACGGTDIDPDDDGVTGLEINNMGCVHAYLTKSQIKNGSFTINPLTEIIYQEISLKYPDGVGNLTAAEIVTLLDEEANKLLDYNNTYNDIITFIPSFDKENSAIDWDTILSRLVKGIHEGEASVNIQNRVLYLNTVLRPEGTTTADDGRVIERLEDIDGDRVQTTIMKTGDNQVGILEQHYVDYIGVAIDVRVEKMFDSKSYLKASLSKAGHVLEFEGVTSLLQDMEYSEAGIATLVGKLVSIDNADDDSFEINIDKALASKISDNEIVFEIDGREPTAEELSVVLDDPRIEWKWSKTKESVPTEILSGIKLDGYNGSDLKVFSDGTIVAELSWVDYEKISGVSEDSDKVIQDGMIKFASTVAGTLADSDFWTAVYEAEVTAGLDSETKLEMAITFAKELLTNYTLDKVKIPLADTLYWILNQAGPIIVERSMPSTRIRLVGEFSNEKNTSVIQGQKYMPMIFFRNCNHPNGTKYKISLGMRYSTEDQLREYGTSGNVYTHSNSSYICELTTTANKGYVIFPAYRTAFFLSQKGRTQFTTQTPSMILWAETDKVDFSRGSSYSISTEGQNIYTDFLYIISDGDIYLNASPCVSSDGTITSYTWSHNNVDIASGKTTILNTTDIDKGNGFGEISLRVSTLTDQGALVTKRIPLDASHWNNPIIYAENFSSDPGYTTYISSNVSGSSSLQWSNGGYYAHVTDNSSAWYCVGESPTFKRVNANDSFRIEFDFNPITPDWGQYPGIYFVDSSSAQAFPSETSERALSFTINWADNVVRKFTLRGPSGGFTSPTIPANNVFYHVTISRDGATGDLSLNVTRQDGTPFINETELNIDVPAFDQLFIGEVQGGPIKYGNSAEIGVDNIIIK